MAGLAVDNEWVDAVPPRCSAYWREVRARASAINSDGCTDVFDIYVDACYEHDIHWRTAMTIDGRPITTAQANRRFRKVIQSRSRLGRFSPLSWVRFAGVSIAAPFLHHKSK